MSAGVFCAVLVLSGCRAAGPAGVECIDDEKFMRGLEAAAGVLCESGAARTLSELRAGLGRARTDASVRAPRAGTSATHWSALYRRRSPGVLVLCRVHKCERCPLWHHASEGCAFVLTDDGLCATARHTFDGTDEHYLVAGTCDGRVLPVVEVLAASEADDVAIIRVAGTGLSPIPLRDAAPAGSEVAVLSHPRHHLYSLSTGVVARRAVKYGGIGGDVKSLAGVPTPVLEITAAFGVGSSGAPILDRAGNAVGMAVSTTTVYAGKKPDGDPQMAIYRAATAGRIARLLEPAAP